MCDLQFLKFLSEKERGRKGKGFLEKSKLLRRSNNIILNIKQMSCDETRFEKDKMRETKKESSAEEICCRLVVVGQGRRRSR